MTIQSAAKNGISRRTVVVGTAWAVPAIVVASAAPALAASGPVQLTGNACKGPGSGQNTKDYYFGVLLSNPSASTVTIVFTTITVNGVTQTLTASQYTYVLGPNASDVPATVIATDFGDSANGSATLTYTINGVAGTTSATFSGFPPIGTPQCKVAAPA